MNTKYTMPIIIPTDSIADIEDLAEIQRIVKAELTPKGFTLKHAPLPHVYQYQGNNMVGLLCFDEPQLFVLEESISRINDAFQFNDSIPFDLPFTITLPMVFDKGKMRVNPRSSMVLINAA